MRWSTSRMQTMPSCPSEVSRLPISIGTGFSQHEPSCGNQSEVKSTEKEQRRAVCFAQGENIHSTPTTGEGTELRWRQSQTYFSEIRDRFTGCSPTLHINEHQMGRPSFMSHFPRLRSRSRCSECRSWISREFPQAIRDIHPSPSPKSIALVSHLQKTAMEWHYLKSSIYILMSECRDYGAHIEQLESSSSKR